MNLSLYQQTKPVAPGASLVMGISKKSAQDIILFSYQLPGAYTGQTQLHTFAGIDDVMWYYQLFESPDGTPTGTVRNYFDVQPNVNSYATRDDLYLTADVSDFFTSGTNGYGIAVGEVDGSLVGWNWSLERVGAGTRQVGVKYVKTKVVAAVVVDTTNDDTDATGWRLLVDDDLIGPNEEWCIHFYPQLQAVTSPSTGKLISATRILTANTSLDNTAIGQAFWLKGGGGYFEVTLPDLATVPDNEPLYFMSDGGMHINVGLKCSAGQSIQWYPNQADLASDTRASKIVLGQQEKIAFYKITLADSSVRWLILYGGEEAKMVGEKLFIYSKIPHNTIQGLGQTLSRTNYARLWAHVQTLEAGCLIADGSFNATSEFDGANYYINHGKYTTGDGATTFRVPLLAAGAGTGVGFLRMVDGTTRTVASFMVDTMADHVHEETIGTLSGSSGGTLFGEGSVTRNKGNYNGRGAGKGDLTDKAGLVVGSTFQHSDKLSYESSPANYGVYGLIRY